MARMAVNKIASARGRAALPVNARPQWHELIPGMLAIGYRKTAKNPPAGTWVARRYVGERKYQQKSLGTADDTMTANGVAILDYRQACAKCRDWCEQETTPVEATVATAMAAYFAERRKAGKSTIFAEKRYAHDIAPALGNVRLSDLTTDRLQNWLYGLANRPRHARGIGGRKSKPITAMPPEDAQRKRQNSSNRTWGILRAALNHVGLKLEGKKVKAFADVGAPKVRFFDDDEIARLLAVTEGDFKLLISSALHTGCRFSELANLKVRDFKNGQIFVETSKSGKPRHIALTDVAFDFFASVTKGRDANELMLTLIGNQWKQTDQTNRMRKACIKADVKHAGFHCLRHSYASHAIIKGCPIVVIAKQLGHAGTAMTEKHYAHLSQGYVAQSIKDYGPTFK